MPKNATIVLCNRQGELLGELDPIRVEMPWWQEVSDVVAAIAERDRIRITVLRLLQTRLPSPTSPSDASDVTYLAELDPATSPPRLRKTAFANPPHPLRCDYAEPGGPTALIEWARTELAHAGLPETGPPAQMRTWNLSAIWRFDTPGGPAWLKVVPPFFAHEPLLIDHLTPGPVPELIAHARGRSLLRHVPGRDVYEGDMAARLRLLDVVVGLQRASVDRLDALTAIGLFDWRTPALVDRMARLPAYARDADREAVETLVAGIEDRLEALAACRFPDTLVHGDAHLMNALLGDDGEITMLDWGDAGVGHPLFDLDALERWRPPDEIATVRDRLVSLWSDLVPEPDVRRAIALCRPLGALREALVYAGFVENVEPDERIYHADDVPAALATAVERAAAEPTA